jgi:hypothetical protein
VAARGEESTESPKSRVIVKLVERGVKILYGSMWPAFSMIRVSVGVDCEAFVSDDTGPSLSCVPPAVVEDAIQANWMLHSAPLHQRDLQSASETRGFQAQVSISHEVAFHQS